MRKGLRLKTTEEESTPSECPPSTPVTHFVPDSKAVTHCDAQNGYSPSDSSLEEEIPALCVTMRHGGKSVTPTQQRENAGSTTAPCQISLLAPHVEMIQAEKEKRIPVRTVRVGAGDINDLNGWVNMQVKKFTTSDDPEDKAEALAEMRLCFAAWCEHFASSEAAE